MINISLDFDPNLALELIHLLDRAYKYYETHDKLLKNGRQSVPYQVVENELSWVTANQLISSKSYQQAATSVDRLPDDLEAKKNTYQILHRFTVQQDFIDSILIEEGETFFGFILRGTKEDSNKIYIVFRGTSEKTEWLQNCKIDQVDFLGKDKVKVSKGFNDVYSCLTDTSIAKQTSISTQLNEELKKIKIDEIDSIIITGHSLGGAIASLAVLETRKIFENKIEPILYTFASPRVGNEDFAQKFEYMPQCFRVFNTEDIVPNLPLSSIFFNGLEMNKIKPLTVSKPRQSFAKNSASDPNTNLFELFLKIKGSVENASFIVRAITNLSLNIFQVKNNRENYLHIGVPVAFTSGTGYITTNHNLYGTYRSAILKMILSKVDPESAVSSRETQIPILR